MKFSAFLLACALLSAPAFAEPVKATLNSGVIVGETQDGVNTFRGVPFAKPPVGDLRWKAPQQPDKWSYERAATALEPSCPQPTNNDGKTANGGGVWGVTSEDCLYLNVYAPANAKKAPIVLWLYGGASFPRLGQSRRLQRHGQREARRDHDPDQLSPRRDGPILASRVDQGSRP